MITTSLFLDNHPTIQSTEREHYLKMNNERLGFNSSESNKINMRSIEVVNSNRIVVENDYKQILQDEIVEIAEKDVKRYEKYKIISDSWLFDKKLLYLVDNYPFLPPFKSTQSSGYRFDGNSLSSMTGLFASISFVWNERNNSSVIVDGRFAEVFQLIYGSEPDTETEETSEMIISNLLKIFDEGGQDNRTLVGDLSLALISFFKNRGEKDTDSSINPKSDQLGKILERRSSVHQSNLLFGGKENDSETSIISKKRKRLKATTGLAAILWWNFEWKVFWLEWERRQGYPTGFSTFQGEMEVYTYSPLIKKANETFNEIFTKSDNFDEEEIYSRYGHLESILMMMFRLYFGQSDPHKSLDTGKLPTEIVQSGNFNLIYPLNIAIIEYGINQPERLIEDDNKRNINSLCESLNLGLSTAHYWYYKRRWHLDFKHSFIRYKEGSENSSILTLLQQFGDLSTHLIDSFSSQSARYHRGVKLANTLITLPIYTDFVEIMKRFRFSTFNKEIFKGILDGGVITRQPQVEFYESELNLDLFNYYLALSSTLGFNKWCLIREKVLGVPLAASSSELEKKIHTISDEQLSDLVGEIIDNAELYKSKLIPLMAERRNKITGQNDNLKDFSSELAYCYYKGIIIEFEITIKTSYSKYVGGDGNEIAGFIRQLPLLLEELHRLELYEKTIHVDQKDISDIVSNTIDIWLTIL